MDSAKISADGQITLPAEVRRRLNLKSGDKVLFLQNSDGEIVVSNAAERMLVNARADFEGAAEALGVKSEADVLNLVKKIRYGDDK